MNGNNRNIYRFIKLSVIVLVVMFGLTMPKWVIQASLNNKNIEVTADFADREIAPNERIGLKLSRDLQAGEGRLAVFIGIADLTSLFVIEPQTLSYTPKFFLLPGGENKLKVYLVQPDDRWKMLA